MELCYPLISSQQVHLIALCPYRVGARQMSGSNCGSAVLYVSQPAYTTDCLQYWYPGYSTYLSSSLIIFLRPKNLIAHLFLFFTSHQPNTTPGWQLCYNTALTLWCRGCWRGRSQPDAGDTDVGRFLGGCYIHLKVRDETFCCQVKVIRIGWWRGVGAVREGVNAPCSGLPASLAVQLDWAELSAARSPCAVISCTGNPKCCLLQVHDWCMMMYIIDVISHRGKYLV